MKRLLFIACLVPSIALAETTEELIARLSGQPNQIIPVPVPAPVAPNGYAIFERERPLPPQWGVDSYRSYKVIPLDRYGNATQPMITMDEVLTDMVWGSIPRDKD